MDLSRPSVCAYGAIVPVLPVLCAVRALGWQVVVALSARDLGSNVSVWATTTRPAGPRVRGAAGHCRGRLAGQGRDPPCAPRPTHQHRGPAAPRGGAWEEAAHWLASVVRGRRG